jgi:hypothetical protein
VACFCMVPIGIPTAFWQNDQSPEEVQTGEHGAPDSISGKLALLFPSQLGIVLHDSSL